MGVRDPIDVPKLNNSLKETVSSGLKRRVDTIQMLDVVSKHLLIPSWAQAFWDEPVIEKVLTDLITLKQLMAEYSKHIDVDVSRRFVDVVLNYVTMNMREFSTFTNVFTQSTDPIGRTVRLIDDLLPLVEMETGLLNPRLEVEIVAHFDKITNREA